MFGIRHFQRMIPVEIVINCLNLKPIYSLFGRLSRLITKAFDTSNEVLDSRGNASVEESTMQSTGV